MMHGKGTMTGGEKMRLAAPMRVLLYMILWYVVFGIFGTMLSGTMQALMWKVTQYANVLVLVFSVGFSAVQMLVMLLAAHKAVFFCREKAWPTVKPMFICYVAMLVGSCVGQLLASLVPTMVFWEIRAGLEDMGAFVSVLLCGAMTLLQWWIIMKGFRGAKLIGMPVDVRSTATTVGFVSLAADIVQYFCPPVYVGSALLDLLMDLPSVIGLLMALWRGLYYDTIDTALPANLGKPVESSAVVTVVERDEKGGIDKSSADDVAEVRRTYSVVPETKERPKRFGMFDRFDLDNGDDERVIAKSSLEAIKVMEHHELDMKHEWNCDDDKGGKH